MFLVGGLASFGKRAVAIGLTLASISTFLLLFMTPLGKEHGLVYLVEEYGLVAYLFALFVVVTGLFTVSSITASGTLSKRIKEGYERAFLRTPWSFLGLAGAMLFFMLSGESVPKAAAGAVGEVEIAIGLGIFYTAIIIVLILIALNRQRS